MIFPHYRQLDAMDCGPTCLRMIAKHYGRGYTLQTLRERSFITREGISMLEISDAAESIGFRTSGIKISLEQLKKETPLPCILHWNQNHFVVLYKIKNDKFSIADPASTLVTFNGLFLLGNGLYVAWILSREQERMASTLDRQLFFFHFMLYNMKFLRFLFNYYSFLCITKFLKLFLHE
jgi:ABC-type bacteriocin/lantibiotic exporter with double-glycine peptidase domain